MAYAGGYAGGYADSIIPPVTEPAGGGGYRYLPQGPPGRQLRTRSRYRLRIISSGVVSHPDSQTIAATLGGDGTQHRFETIATARAEATTGHTQTARAVYQAHTGGKGIIPDPDEWLIFLEERRP